MFILGVLLAVVGVFVYFLANKPVGIACMIGGGIFIAADLAREDAYAFIGQLPA